ncbi:MAG: hypothetical protein ACYC7E_06575 [Armatimonadota bacterium]
MMKRDITKLVCMFVLVVLCNVSTWAFTQYTTGTLTVSPSTLYVASGQSATFTLTISGSVAGGATTGNADLYYVSGSTGTKVATIPVNNTTKQGTATISVSSAPFNNEPGDYRFFARIPWATGGFSDTSPYITVSVKVNIVYEHHLWWFNGVNPPAMYGYYTQTDLSAVGLSSGYYRWEIDAGSDYARWSDGSIIIDRTTNGVTLVSTNASAAEDDIRVYLYWKKTSGGTYYRCGSYTTTVKAPNGLSKINTNTVNKNYSFYPFDHRGYTTEIHYEIRDQFSTVLPSTIPWNENFTGGVTSAPAYAPPNPQENWGRGPAVGWVVDPSDAYDTIASWDSWPRSFYPSPLPYPQATPTLVNSFPGEWNVGSVNIGNGRRVKTLTWETYRDRGAHNP